MGNEEAPVGWSCVGLRGKSRSVASRQELGGCLYEYRIRDTGYRKDTRRVGLGRYGKQATYTGNGLHICSTLSIYYWENQGARPETGMRAEESKVLSRDVVSIVKTYGPISRVGVGEEWASDLGVVDSILGGGGGGERRSRR